MNTKIFSLIILIICCPIFAFTSTEDTKKKQMLNTLDVIKNTFDVKYAPAEWKKIYTNWDLDDQINQSKRKVLTNSTMRAKEFQRIVKNFFNSTKDYHVNVFFYSTEIAFLPFRVHGANGKYFIAWVPSYKAEDLEEGQELFELPFKAGDEVVLFDGKPTDDTIQELKAKEFGNPDSDTDQKLAEGILTLRIGIMGHDVPQGPVSITIKHKDTNEIATYYLEWFYFPEQIQSKQKFSSNKASEYSSDDPLSKHPFFHKKMNTPLHDQFQFAYKRLAKKLKNPSCSEEDNKEEQNDEEQGFEIMGTKKSFIPNLGEIVWQVEQNQYFHAYIFKTSDGHHIGYIRIPTFDEHSSASKVFEELIQTMEQKTEALVIDQVNNPGGSLFYMYGLASMLSDKSLQTPTEKITITQEDILIAIESLNSMQGKDNESIKEDFELDIDGFVIDDEFINGIKDYFYFILNEWNEGRSFTNPHYLYGVKYIRPHPRAHYSKPILFLVNSLDFSCADFLPAILQDNKRAVIFGSKTAGAGGFVLPGEFPNKYGIAGFTFTGSIAERMDQKPIENLGITPDISYELTEKDLQEGYQGYKEAVLKALQSMLK